MAFEMWYVIYVEIVQLKQPEFFEFRGFQPGIHRVGHAQVACRDADALNGALVGGDDGSGEFKIIE